MSNTRRMNRLEELGRVDAEKAYTRKGKRNLKDEKKRIVRELKSKGGGIGAQTHGVKLARALNTRTPDHSKFLNEHGYLKGGVPVKNG